MSETERNQKLNQILVDMLRSLVQYVAECWPWTSQNETAERDQIAAIQQSQREQIGRLAELLSQREWPIDLGSYPTDYTSLHYVSMDYLLSLMVENEESLVSELEQSRTRFADDPAVKMLLDEILAEERSNLQTLRKLAGSRSSNLPPEPQAAH